MAFLRVVTAVWNSEDTTPEKKDEYPDTFYIWDNGERLHDESEVLGLSAFLRRENNLLQKLKSEVEVVFHSMCAYDCNINQTVKGTAVVMLIALILKGFSNRQILFAQMVLSRCENVEEKNCIVWLYDWYLCHVICVTTE